MRGVVVFVAACAPAGDDSPAATSIPFALGVVESQPAILFSPVSGVSVAATDVTYDAFGSVESYAVAYVSEFGDTLRGLVLDADTGEDPGARRFVARIGGDSLVPLESGDSPHALAFIPRDPGGLRLKGADSVLTEFAYDDFGRQQVAAQEFTIGPARWRGTFSNQSRDGFGRFTSLTLTIAQR